MFVTIETESLYTKPGIERATGLAITTQNLSTKVQK